MLLHIVSYSKHLHIANNILINSCYACMDRQLDQCPHKAIFIGKILFP